MRLSTLAFTTVVLTSSSISATAADCNPTELLRQNIDSYQGNFTFWLASAKQLVKQTNSDDKTEVGLTYKGVPFSASDVSTLSQYVSEKTSFQLSETQSVSILRSTLSPESVKAYLGCIGANRGVTIAIPDLAMDAEEFVVKVAWDPDYNPTDSKLELVMAGATVAGKTDVEIRPTQSKSFVIKRDPKKPLFLSATIDGKSDEISLPRTPQFTIEFSERFFPPEGEKALGISRGVGSNTTDLITLSACVAAENGAILLPGTAKMDVSILDSQNRAKAIIDTDNSSLRVCGKLSASSGAQEVKVSISGRLRVFEALARPAN